MITIPSRLAAWLTTFPDLAFALFFDRVTGTYHAVLHRDGRVVPVDFPSDGLGAIPDAEYIVALLMVRVETFLSLPASVHGGMRPADEREKLAQGSRAQTGLIHLFGQAGYDTLMAIQHAKKDTVTP